MPPPDELLPYLLFSLPWFIALYQVCQGLTAGKLREYTRTEAAEAESRTPRYLTRDKSPVGFCCLFAFYILILLLVPLGMYHAATHRPADPPQNPGSSSTRSEHANTADNPTR